MDLRRPRRVWAHKSISDHTETITRDRQELLFLSISELAVHCGMNDYRSTVFGGFLGREGTSEGKRTPNNLRPRWFLFAVLLAGRARSTMDLSLKTETGGLRMEEKVLSI